MEMTITKALAELKLLDKRINKAIDRTDFVNYCVGKKPVNGYNSNKDFDDDVRANYQSILDLIDRRDKIKSAIIQSNVDTTVEIAGEKMTVASAIEKKTSIAYKQFLLNKMEQNLVDADYEVSKINKSMQDRLDKLLETNFGKESNGKSYEVETISKPFKEQNEAKLVNPLNIKKKIQELTEHIDEFISEVDFVLSTSNSTHYINI